MRILMLGNSLTSAQDCRRTYKSLQPYYGTMQKLLPLLCSSLEF